ncbi:MAG TPA: hypothetical protein VIJ57_08860 [Hanamia sp.]
MEKLIIPFNGNTIEQIEKPTDNIFKEQIGWDAFLEMLSKVIHLRPWDQVDGLIMDEQGIEIKISQKRGRKAKHE